MLKKEYHDLSTIPFHCGQHLAYLGCFFPLLFNNFRHPTIRFDVSNRLSRSKLKCVTRNHKSVCLLLCLGGSIGHVNECPTMHYFGIPTHTQSMIGFLQSIAGDSNIKLHCGNVVNMPKSMHRFAIPAHSMMGVLVKA